MDRPNLVACARIIALILIGGAVVWQSVRAEDEDPEDDEIVAEPFYLLVVGDKTIDQNIIEILNASVQETNEKLLRLEYIVPRDVNQDKAYEDICERAEDQASFMISITNNVNIMSAVVKVERNAKIPTIQMDFSTWMYPGTDKNNSKPTEWNLQDLNAVRPKERNFISVVPPWTVEMGVLRSLFAETNVTSQVAVIYDDLFPMKTNGKPSIYQLMLQKAGVPIKTFVFPNASDIVSQIKSMKQLKIKNILLMCDVKNTQKYILKAKSHISSFRWFYYSNDADSSFQCEECQNVDMFWIRPTTGIQQFIKIDDFRDWLKKTQEIDDLVVNNNQLMAAFYHDMVRLAWNVILDHNSSMVYTYPTYNCINETDAPNNTKKLSTYLFESTFDGSFGKYIFYDQNKLFQDLLVKIVKVQYEPSNRYSYLVANWTASEQLMINIALDRNMSTFNKYRIAIVQQPPFIEKVIAPNGTVTWRGYCIDLIQKIQYIMKFEYELFEVKDGMFGAVDDQGNWNGLVKELITGDAQIALAPLSVTAERENVVDFTVPYYDLVGTTILMKKQEPDRSLFKFMTVLEGPVWGCIVGAYFFTSFLLWIFDKFSPYSYTNNKDKYKDDPEKREFTFKECLWFCMTSLTPQGGGEAPKNISGRLVAATWWLFGFIIIASYTANLAAFLTVSRLETPIASLDDLAKQYKIKYAPVRGTASETYFKRMAEIEDKFYEIWKAMSLDESMTPQERAQLAVWDYPVSDKFTNMWRYMLEAKLPNSTEDAIARVLRSPSTIEGFAYIGDATEIRYAVLTNCQLQQVGGEFSRKPYAVAVQQGATELKDNISAAILQLLNERDLEQLKEIWWNENPNKKNCPKAEDESDGISIENIGGVFIVILVGIGLSIITLVFEYWYYKDRPPPGSREEADGNKALPMTNKETSFSPKDLNANSTANGNMNGFANGDAGHYNLGNDIKD